MAIINLSTLISKVLKELTLNSSEQAAFCTEIGAVHTNDATVGGSGSDDDGKVALYTPSGGMYFSTEFYIEGFESEPGMSFSGSFPGGHRFRLAGARIGSECSLYFPDPVSGAEIYLPDYSCTLAGVDTGTGLFPVETIPQVTTAVVVADNAERLSLGVAAALNKIVVDYENADYPLIYVLEPDAVATNSEGDWIGLGHLLFASEGGNGAADATKAAVYGADGNLIATKSVGIASTTEATASLMLSCEGFDSKIVADAGTYKGTLIFPTETDLTEDREWEFPDEDGTILTHQTGVTIHFDQDIIGGKAFLGPVDFGDDVSFTDPLVSFVVAPVATFSNDVEVEGILTAPNQTADTVDSVITRELGDVRYGATIFSKLDSDAAPVTTSVTPVDSGLEIDLGIGIWELNFFGYLTHGGTGGLRVKFAFDGTMDPVGGVVETNSSGSSSVKTTIPHVTTDGYTADITKVGGTDSSVETKIVFDVTVLGTLKVQFAQSVSNATATIMEAGSYVYAKRIA